MCMPFGYFRRGLPWLAASFLVLACFVFPAFGEQLHAQEVGDTVRLESSNPQGVPVHPAAGDMSYVRWANGTVATVTAIDPATGWFRVESAGNVGWVTRRYLTVIPGEPPEAEPENEILSYVVGTWNLEYLHNTRSRGFPEYIHGGPRYAPRTDADYQRIAQVVTTQLFAQILVLNEINGRGGTTRSDELDRLIGFLGLNWAYELTRSGRNQRVAILYDTQVVRRDGCVEIAVAEERLNRKDIFDKDPLACLFTFLDAGGQARNDVLVVGLHLASGQDRVRNHNRAMEVLRGRLQQAFADGTFPAGETDILIGGDLNASRYDNRIENFWEGYDAGGFAFVTLSPADGTEYPGTRLAGVPLFPRSQIDYLIASGVTGGLAGDLVQSVGHVHLEVLVGGFDDFREHVSDHIPVTVRIRVVDDDD